jgi:tetratricopeptide (TPR) repeat protein
MRLAIYAALARLPTRLLNAYRNRDPVSLAGAHGLQLITRHARGDLPGCETHFAAGLRSFNTKFVPAPAGAVIDLGVASWNAWLLGRFDLAHERERQTLEAANSSDPFEVGNSIAAAAFLRELARDYELADRFATKTFEIAVKHHFDGLTANAQCLLGFARALLGRASEGVALLREGLLGLAEIGTVVGASCFTACLAAAQMLEGSIIDALATVEKAIQINPEELAYRPETLRLRGEIQLRIRRPELAEADFGAAIALAQKIGARALELRATVSQARLLDEQGRRDEARSMLAVIHNWFTEGFDTADLKEAKALLDELSR